MFIFLAIGWVVVGGTAVATVAGPMYAATKVIKTIGLHGYPAGAGPLSRIHHIALLEGSQTEAGRLLWYLSYLNPELEKLRGKTLLLVKPEVEALDSLLKPIAMAMEGMTKERREQFAGAATQPVAAFLGAIIDGAKVSFRRVVAKG